MLDGMETLDRLILRREAKLLVAWKGPRDAIDFFDERHRSLPYLEIAKRFMLRHAAYVAIFMLCLDCRETGGV